MKTIITCCVVEDEPLAQEVLATYIDRVPFLKLLGSYLNPLEATPYLEKEKPDLLFLDINLPDMDGLSFIPLLRHKPAIIITTAYDEFALKGYELEVDDYLLKPIAFERFYKGVLKVFNRLNQTSEAPSDGSPMEITRPHDDYLFMKVGHRIQKIVLSEIHYIQGMKDYLQIHTAKEKIMVLMSFAQMMDLLPQHRFVRVHKSYIVAIDKINHIERNRISIANQIIPVSETFSELLLQKLKGIN